MSFLFPTMLAGLAALAVPVVLHLIARHNFPVRDFPSIQLLRREKRSNVFAPKLVDKKQLLLRLLVLFLLVLAMARLFLPIGGGRQASTGGSGAATGGAPQNLVVVLDCSASMGAIRRPAGGAEDPGSEASTLLALGRSRAEELLSRVAAPGHTAVVGAGRQTRVLSPLLPGHERSVEAVSDAETTGGQGEGLVAAMARAAEMLAGRHEARSRIVVLTDMRRSAFTRREQRHLERIRRVRRRMGDALEVVLLEMSAGPTGESHNLAVVEARVRDAGGSHPVRGVQVGDDAHVVARVRYSAPERAEDPGGQDEEADEGKKTEPVTARMRLLLGNQKEPVGREIQFDPAAGESEAVVDLTTRVNKPVQVFARPYIERKGSSADSLQHDDARSVPLKVANLLRCLIIDGTVQEQEAEMTGLPGETGGETEQAAPRQVVSGVKVLRYVLNPVRELGRGQGTGINSTVVTPEGLAGQTLSKYSVIFLYDVSSLAERALEDLDTFVQQGGSLLFICSGGLSPMKFNRTLASAAGERAALAPALVGNEVTCDPPVGIERPSGGEEGGSLLDPFSDKRRGDLSVVRLSAVRGIRSMGEGARVLFRTRAGGREALPLAVERKRGRGRVMLLTFGFELDRTNIARTRVFPVLMWRMVAFLTGGLEESAERSDVLTALQPAVLDASEQRFAFVDRLELAPVSAEAPEPIEGLNPALTRSGGVQEPLSLPIREDRTVLVEGVPAGDYRLQKVQEEGVAPMVRRGRLVSVNPDPTESDMAGVSAGTLEELRSLGGEEAGPFRVVGAAERLSLAPGGMEMWKLLVVVLAVAYAAEGAIGWWLSAQREKERSAGVEA